MLCITNIALTLLATVAGMFLLAKANKDNLGGFFKGVAIGVIVVGILSFLCAVGCGLCSAGCGKGNKCGNSCSISTSCCKQQSCTYESRCRASSACCRGESSCSYGHGSSSRCQKGSTCKHGDNSWWKKTERVEQEEAIPGDTSATE